MSCVAFIYEITERGKTIVDRTWDSDLLDNNSFADLFDKVAPTDVKEKPVTVSIGFKSPHKEPIQFINVKLIQKLNLLNRQGANFVRFQLTRFQLDTVNCHCRSLYDSEDAR